MQPFLTDLLSASYQLPALQSITPVDAGYLSRNWLIATNDGHYFLKQYRFDDFTPVAAAHTALFHFHRSGIPVIVPLATVDDQTICTWHERYYSLFPFVTARQLRRGALSQQAVQSIGTMLARLHLAGRNVKVPHVRERLPQDGRARFVREATTILERIARQSPHTQFDELAATTVRRQLALVAETAMDYTTLGLAADHLLHGDFHDGNLFFNKRDEVSALYDWEKTEIAPRESEVVRALLFTCFSNPDNFRGTFALRNFALGEQFLKAYHTCYPLELATLRAAVHARYWGSLCSLWVPTEHYLRQNHRVDLFLESNLAEITYFAGQMAPFVDWIAKVLDA